MKLNSLISQFTIAMSNEEAALFEKIQQPTSILDFSERERHVMKNLIRKSLVTKVNNNGDILVVRNE